MRLFSLFFLLFISTICLPSTFGMMPACLLADQEFKNDGIENIPGDGMTDCDQCTLVVTKSENGTVRFRAGCGLLEEPIIGKGCRISADGLKYEKACDTEGCMGKSAATDPSEKMFKGETATLCKNSAGSGSLGGAPGAGNPAQTVYDHGSDVFSTSSFLFVVAALVLAM